MGIVEPGLAGDDGNDVAVVDGPEFAAALAEVVPGNEAAHAARVPALKGSDAVDPLGVRPQCSVGLRMGAHVVEAHVERLREGGREHHFGHGAAARLLLHPERKVVEAGEIAVGAAVEIA